MELNKLIRENLRKYSAYEPVEQQTENGWIKLQRDDIYVERKSTQDQIDILFDIFVYKSVKPVIYWDFEEFHSLQDFLNSL